MAQKLPRALGFMEHGPIFQSLNMASRYARTGEKNGRVATLPDIIDSLTESKFKCDAAWVSVLTSLVLDNRQDTPRLFINHGLNGPLLGNQDTLQDWQDYEHNRSQGGLDDYAQPLDTRVSLRQNVTSFSIPREYLGQYSWKITKAGVGRHACWQALLGPRWQDYVAWMSNSDVVFTLENPFHVTTQMREQTGVFGCVLWIKDFNQDGSLSLAAHHAGHKHFYNFVGIRDDHILGKFGQNLTASEHAALLAGIQSATNKLQGAQEIRDAMAAVA